MENAQGLKTIPIGRRPACAKGVSNQDSGRAGWSPCQAFGNGCSNFYDAGCKYVALRLDELNFGGLGGQSRAEQSRAEQGARCAAGRYVRLLCISDRFESGWQIHCQPGS
jgi:hypothetical protein